MTRPRCEVCGCPMRMDRHTYDGGHVAECRPCWLMTVGTAPGTDGRTAFAPFPPVSIASEEMRARQDDANDTANTAATSTWLPPGANDPDVASVAAWWSASTLFGVGVVDAMEAQHPRDPMRYVTKAGDP